MDLTLYDLRTGAPVDGGTACIACHRTGVLNDGRGTLTVSASPYTPGVKQTVRDVFAKRVQEISHKSEHKPFAVVAIGLPYFVNITTNGDTAKIVTVPRDRLVELTMERYGERWKVTAIKDDPIVQRIVDELIGDLPAIGRLK